MVYDVTPNGEVELFVRIGSCESTAPHDPLLPPSFRLSSKRPIRSRTDDQHRYHSGVVGGTFVRGHIFGEEGVFPDLGSLLPWSS